MGDDSCHRKSVIGKKVICDFLEELSRDVPTLPAGGSVVALAGALAAALERFVSSLTLRQLEDPKAGEGFKKILSRLERLQEKCVEMMDRDVKEYERVIQVLQMPNATEEEQVHREAALQEANSAALIPPMALVECGLELLRRSSKLIDEGHEVALADVGVAAEMANASFWGGLWVARANLPGISDPGFVEHHRQLLETLQTEAEDWYQQIREKLNKRL
jgi:formiminotetrahydrofolate cyclodeaminase